MRPLSSSKPRSPSTRHAERSRARRHGSRRSGSEAKSEVRAPKIGGLGGSWIPAALAALHLKGFLHGDVKPSNIGFTAEGSPTLLDFGSAPAADPAAIPGGTLPYLSPEILAGRSVEEADVWSLCVVLDEMVSGQHPVTGGDPGGPPVAALGDRARLRRGAGRSLRERVAKIFKLFSACLSGSLLPYVIE